MSKRCPSIFAVDIKLVWWSWLSQIQPISPVSPLLPISPHTLLTGHGTSSCTKHTEVRKLLLKPELKSRLRPLSFWDLQVVFLSAPPSCGTGAISYPPPLHCPVWSWSCRDRRKKSEGGLESFVWVFLHLGIYQKKGCGFPCRANWASRQQDTELTWLSWHGLQTSPCHSSQQHQQRPGVFIWPAYKDFQWQKLHHLPRQPVPAPLCSHCLLERFSYHYPESFQL